MKRFVAFLIAITVLFAFSAFAQAKPAAAKMKTCSAKVTAISESMVKADRIVKGKTEVFECTLEKPVKDIVVGDEVNLSYKEVDGKKICVEVAKIQKK